jgi:hypothetical protein
MSGPVRFTRPSPSRCVVVVWMLMILGCEQDVEHPFAPTRSVAVQSDTTGAPFYYFEGKPIYLQADPERLVVATTALTSAQSVTDAVSSHGLEVGSATSMIQANGHWLVQLKSGTSASAATAGVRSLKVDSRFTFASTAYRTVEGQHDFVPINRLGVIFKPGVSHAQIDSLNASFGTRIIRPPKPEWGIRDYGLAFPTDSLSDYLGVAAAYSRSPLVQWAAPDRIADVEKSSIPNDPYFPQQYYLANSASLYGIPVDDNVENAWDLSRGAGVVVAVVDDGVDATHEDLNVLCGYDAINDSPDICPCTDCATAPFDGTVDYHGTYCAGIG